MDLTFPIRWVIPEKDLIDWGQDTTLRQNINFFNSIVFLQERQEQVRMKMYVIHIYKWAKNVCLSLTIRSNGGVTSFSSIKMI